MKPLGKSLIAAALALVAISPAYALGTPKPDEFVMKASTANLFEIESAKVALERSTNPDVKAFAQKMVSDHGTAGEAMKAAATTANVQGSVASILDKKHQKIIDDLKAEEAEDFDEEYVDEQEDAHRKTVKLFEKYAEDGEDASLKTFAANTLPTLKAHKSEVKTLEEKVDAAEDMSK